MNVKRPTTLRILSDDFYGKEAMISFKEVTKNANKVKLALT